MTGPQMTEPKFMQISGSGSVLAIAAGALMVMALTLGSRVHGADTYYRWKDERGKLVISDRTPEDLAVDYEVVSLGSTTLVRRAPPGEGALAPEVTPEPGNETRQGNRQDMTPQETTPQETMEVIPKDPEICAQARTNLETLNTSARIRIRDRDSGEPRFISEEEREIQRQKARDTIHVHCE